LLAYLVGCNGSVVSIDIDPEITKRAKALFQDQPNVSLFTGDGQYGCANNAPYDRIVAWATAQTLPAECKGINEKNMNGINRGLNKEVIAQFMASAFVGLVEWWIKNKMPLPPQVMAQHIWVLFERNGISVDS
jgi:hypothetical protein